MPPKVVNEADPDVVDNTQPAEQYDDVNVPLRINVGDERQAEDHAQARDRVRKQKREMLVPKQPVASGANYTRAPQRRQPVQMDAADPDYIEMLVVDNAPRANENQLGNGGSEAIQEAAAGQGAPIYDNFRVVTHAELISHHHAVSEALETMRAEAAAAEKAQNAKKAADARARKHAILNSVFGSIGALGTMAAILAVYLTRPTETDGPVAADVNGGSKLDPAKPTKVNVAKHAQPGQGGKPIDANSIQLASHNAGDTKAYDIADVGGWKVHTDGSIEFTPDPKFDGGQVSILFTIADTAGARSNRAQVSMGYTLKSMPGTGGPLVQSFEQTHLISDTVSIDVATVAKPGPSGAAVKADSIVLIGAAAKTPQSLFQRGLGTWGADANGKITFVPIDGFKGGSVAARYTIADANGNTSDTGGISLSYYKRPQVFDIAHNVAGFVANTAADVNVIDGTGGVPKPVADPTLKIDPASVILTGLIQSETEAKGPTATVSADSKTLTVPGEGVWSASDPKGKVSFTPDSALKGDPHPITFQVGDTKGVLSNVGTLVMSDSAAKIAKALGNVNALDDTAFWALIDTKVFKGELGDDPVNRLLMLRGVITDLWLNTRNAVADDDKDNVFTQRDAVLRGVLGPDFNVWRAGKPTDAEPPMSPAKLFTLSKAYDDAKVGLKGVKHGTRYVRLTYIHMLLGFFSRYMSNK